MTKFWSGVSLCGFMWGYFHNFSMKICCVATLYCLYNEQAWEDLHLHNDTFKTHFSFQGNFQENLQYWEFQKTPEIRYSNFIVSNIYSKTNENSNTQ